MLQRSMMKSGSGLSNGSSRVLRRIAGYKQPSVQDSPGSGFKRPRDIAAPAHLGALIAAKPRIQGMIRDAVWAGLLPEQILETCLTVVIETATTTYLSALDSDEQATAKLYVQKQPRWQTKPGSKQLGDCRDLASQTRPSHPLNIPAPPPKRRTATSWISQRP